MKIEQIFLTRVSLYTTSLFFKFHDCPMLWSSYLQPTLALSMTKIEYHTLMDATRKATLIQALLAKLQAKTYEPTIICRDNMH
jgi:hypothetical protein